MEDYNGHEKVWINEFIIHFVKGGVLNVLFSLLMEGTK